MAIGECREIWRWGAPIIRSEDEDKQVSSKSNEVKSLLQIVIFVSLMFRKVKNLIPKGIKKRLLYLLSRAEMPFPQGKRAFLFLAADYGNIGDLAITAAQRNFLERHAGSFQVVPVPISRTVQLIRFIRRNATPEDLITIVGGGNMGVLYPDIEELRQWVIKSFPENRIVCFPQTLDWSDDAKSTRALNRIKRVYSRHPDIHLFARESISHDRLLSLFAGHANVRVGYAPDIVLSAAAEELGFSGRPDPFGILLCMRDDRERLLDAGQLAQLRAALEATGLDIMVTDTHAGGSRLREERCAQLLADKLGQFAGARLVVTDRLHGMILSMVAGAPCLVLPNNNHKIRRTWQDWLIDLPQLKFVEPAELSELPGLVAALLATPRRELNRPPLASSHYDSLINAITAQ